MTIYGFTGTRYQPSDPQCAWITTWAMKDDYTAGHHGVCVGSDAVFHRMTLLFSQAHVFMHPPINESFLDTEALQLAREHGVPNGHITILEAKDYHARNHDIVDACEFLLATPNGPETPKGGTWGTIRYARKVGKPGMICYPDGRVEDL